MPVCNADSAIVAMKPLGPGVRVRIFYAGNPTGTIIGPGVRYDWSVRVMRADGVELDEPVGFNSCVLESLDKAEPGESGQAQ